MLDELFFTMIKVVLGACTIYPLAKFIYNKILDDIAKRIFEKMKHYFKS